MKSFEEIQSILKFHLEKVFMDVLEPDKWSQFDTLINDIAPYRIYVKQERFKPSDTFLFCKPEIQLINDKGTNDFLLNEISLAQRQTIDLS